jgi:hypothetical protein
MSVYYFQGAGNAAGFHAAIYSTRARIWAHVSKNGCFPSVFRPCCIYFQIKCFFSYFVGLIRVDMF